MKQCISQQGRSMIEMLGVLVIIGVLSISALIGYRYAIDKHRTNVILNDIKTLIVFALSSDFLNKYPSATATPADIAVDTVAPHPYTLVKETSDTFYVETKQVPSGVCSQLVKSEPQYVEEVIANLDEGGTCRENETNVVYFFINGNMGQTPENPDRFDSCSDETPCPGSCSDCINGRCIDNNKKCGAGQYCIKGECSDCQKGFLKVGQQCRSCQTAQNIEYPGVSFAECHKCPNRVSNGNNCYQCDRLGSLYFSKTLCDRCPNRAFMGNNLNNGVCILCSAPEPYESTQAQCDACPDRVRIGTQCVLGCKKAGAWNSNKANCDKCPNLVYMGQTDSGGGCFDCDTFTYYPNATEDQCAKCSETIWHQTTATTGTCAVCSKAGATPNPDGTGCVCPNGKIWTFQDGNHSACKDCPTEGNWLSMDKSECDKCSDLVFVGIDNRKGWCMSCSFNGIPNNGTQEQCDKCPNRIFMGNVNNGLCVPSCKTRVGYGSTTTAQCDKCASDGYRFFGTNTNSGICAVCTSTQKYSATPEQCAACPDRFSESLTAASWCLSCNTTEMRYTSKEACLKCKNRYWVLLPTLWGECRLCTGTVSADGLSCN